jgi:uncharacterized coiled-coil DUF342 family protein
LNSAREKIPFKSSQDIDRRVAEMEALIEGQTLPLIEEKRMVAEISKLKKMKKNMDAVSQSSNIEIEKTRVKSLKNALDEKKAELDQLSNNYVKIQERLKELDSKKDSSANAMKHLLDQRSKLSKTVNELYDQKRTAQQELVALNERNRERIEEEKKQRIEQNRIRDLERQIGMLRRSKNALIATPPFQYEIEQCQALITYFHQFIKKDAKSPASPIVEGINSLNIRRPDDNGFLPKGVSASVFSKKEDDDFYSSMSKKKKEKDTKEKAVSESTVKLTLPLAILSGLSALQVSIPSTITDVPTVVEFIENRKSSFEDQVQSQIEENKAKAHAIEQQIAELEAQKANGSAIVQEVQD